MVDYTLIEEDKNIVANDSETCELRKTCKRKQKARQGKYKKY